MMKITRKSPYSGAVRVMDIDVTQEQLERWHDGELIQNVMPHLTVNEREFIISGMTEDEWNAAFGEYPEDDEIFFNEEPF